jgi:hypothetical protein
LHGRFSPLILNFLKLSLPYRIGLVLLSGLIGSSVLGFLSEYAVYSYAVANNSRPPFEGIDFLRFAIFSTSFFLYLGCFSLFIFTYYYADYIYFTLTHILFLPLYLLCKSLAIAKIPIMQSFYRRSGLDTMMNMFNRRYYYEAALREQHFAEILRVLKSQPAPSYSYYWIALIFILVIASYLEVRFAKTWIAALFTLFLIIIIAMVLAKRDPISRVLVSFGFSILFFLSVMLVMFSPHLYSYFLHFIKYGGDHQISVVLRDESIRLSGRLILRSNNSLSIVVNGEKNTTEIPMDSIDYVIYISGATD